MLWFNNFSHEPIKHVNAFQYILCYGSTNVIKEIREKLEDFNTSYVMVQRFSCIAGS